MGRREIAIGSLLAVLGLGGTAVVTALTTTATALTPYLVCSGIAAMVASVVGLARMFINTPKALLQAAAPRDFLAENITPAVLRRKVEGRTQVQIEALNKTYAGKWMAVEGRVDDVHPLHAGSCMVHLKEDGAKYGILASVVFEPRWLGQLSALNIGDWISLVGQVDRLNHGVILKSGEIVHMGEPPQAPPTPKPRAPRKKAAPKA